MLKKLLAVGGKEWKKGDFHRVYFNEEILFDLYGLTYDGWKFIVDGEKVSNNKGRGIASRIRCGKFYYDLVTDEFASRDISDEMTKKLVERMMTRLETTETEEVVEEAAGQTAEETVIATDVKTSSGSGIFKNDVRINKKSGRCRICGGLVKAGEGYLYYIDPDEAYEHSGWVVEHKDKAECKKRLDSEVNLYS